MNAALLSQISVLFGLIIVGYIANKCTILDEHTNEKLSSFLLKIALPSTILSSALENTDVDKMQVVNVAVIAVSIFIALPVLTVLLTRVLRLDKTYSLMLNYGNLGFMGIPIVSSVFGSEYVIYVAVFMMVFNIHIFTVGVIILQGKPSSLKEMVKKLCTPGVIAALMAFVIVLVGISVPAPLENLLESVGSTTTPMAMIEIGSQLAQVNLLDSVRKWRLYLMSVFKLIAYPALVYVVLSILIGADTTPKIATILCGMPVEGNVTMLCSEYRGDTALAAEGTCVSTLLSVLTIPIMLALLV